MKRRLLLIFANVAVPPKAILGFMLVALPAVSRIQIILDGRDDLAPFSLGMALRYIANPQVLARAVSGRGQDSPEAPGHDRER